ncbi:MAG: hypothetical protein IEMM0003_0278 [bacterium]|nr:MAG: hypothetical protein IEMM0003_0278 [bacterium]
MVRSKIKITGVKARFYDLLVNLATGFKYGKLVKDTAAKMNITEGVSLIDLGGGTGKNAKLFARSAGNSGRIVLVDIGKTMLKKAGRRLKKYKNSEVVQADILKPLKLNGFDMVFIGFIMHGLEIQERSALMKNVSKLLKRGGHLFILDYNQFDMKKLNPIAGYLFNHFECELATEFIKWDMERFLRSYKLGKFEKWYWHDKKIRLLRAEKL